MSGPNTHNTIVSFFHTKATGSIIPRGRERDAKLEIPFIFSGRDFENVIPKAKHVIAWSLFHCFLHHKAIDSMFQRTCISHLYDNIASMNWQKGNPTGAGVRYCLRLIPQRLVLSVINNDCMNVFIVDNHERIPVVTVALNQILQLVCQCQQNFFGVSNRCPLQVTGSVCNYMCTLNSRSF